jgi:hypothetical protein
MPANNKSGDSLFMGSLLLSGLASLLLIVAKSGTCALVRGNSASTAADLITFLNTRTAAAAKVPLHFPKHGSLSGQWLLTQVNIPTPRRFYSPVQKGSVQLLPA